MSKEDAQNKISEIIAKYQALSPSAIKTTNEQSTINGFIMPLFTALGWDFCDTNEVSPEYTASGGRVDLAFRLNGVSQFFLEAKKFSADLNDPDFVKQAVTYAYNKGVTWAVLTDFQNIRLYNANTGKGWLFLDWDKYATEHFEKLWLLSKESLQNGLLTAEAKANNALPPSIPVEQKLFKQLRSWREALFNQLHIHNEQLSLNQLDEVIQRLFNRLIFIRTAEDRHIEDNHLKAAVHQWEANKHKKDQLLKGLRDIFRYFDGFYDSELFEPHLTDTVFIEEPTISDILIGLYEIPGGVVEYDFSIIDADVLGAVYEQYLGYVADIARRRAKEAQSLIDLGLSPTESKYEVTAKKQHRKEQGIYYTPKFITDYIVKETVGRYLKEHAFNENRTVKILDPSCGSGSFLIRAFDELLTYHAKESGKSVAELSQYERLRILTTNVHGVDLDRQAVEIARLNMLLRSLAKQELLPGLKDNVKQGNSLITGGEEELKGYFGEGWRDKRPFNWDFEYKDVIAQGGFDVIIGNPPYVRIQSLSRDEADYYRSHFESAHGSFDLYVLFIEQAIKLLKIGGRLGLITSGKFLKSDYGKKIQQLINEQCTVEEIVDLSAQQVFGDATTYPVIMFIRKGSEEVPFRYVFIPDDAINPHDIANTPATMGMQKALIQGSWPLIATDDIILAKLGQKAKLLGEISNRIFQGLVTGADKTFILEKRGDLQNGFTRIYSRSMSKEYEIETSLLKPLLLGVDVGRYEIPNPRVFLLFPYIVSEDRATLLSSALFEHRYPNAWKYLLDNRHILENREKGKMKHDKWYSFSRVQSLAMHEQPKLLTGVLARKSRFTADLSGVFYSMGGGNAGVYGITLQDCKSANYLYVLGLLNSTLIQFNLRKLSSPFRGGFFSYAQRYINKLPIRQIDFANPDEKTMHDRIIVLVERMLDLNKRLAPIREIFSNERDEILEDIEKTDKEIDGLVYKLYGLTDEEIRVVEGAG